MANSLYKVLPGQATPPLASDINQVPDALTGVADIGQILLAAAISAPSSAGVTAAATTGTTLGIGAYRYQLTYVTGTKKSDGTVSLGPETNGSTAILVTTTSGNQAVNLSALPTTWPSTAVALRIYRTALGGADGTQKLVATIIVPVATYKDVTADGALGVTIPATNTTGTTLPVGNVTGILSLTNGGTGSATQNFVDLTTVQSIGGAKTFSGLSTFNAGATILAAQPFTNNGTFAGSAILPISMGGTGSAAQIFVDLSAAQSIAGAKTFTAPMAIDSTTATILRLSNTSPGMEFQDNIVVGSRTMMAAIGMGTVAGSYTGAKGDLNIITASGSATNNSAINFLTASGDAFGYSRRMSISRTGAVTTTSNTLDNGTTGDATIAGALTINGSGGSFANSKATNGYQKLPGGLIIQWGRVSVTLGSFANVTFPVSFPNALLVPIVSCPQNLIASAGSRSPSNMDINLQGPGPGSTFVDWMVIGW